MTLPAPDKHALLRSKKLAHLIRQEIENSGGNISFARYMELALYTPILGFYNSNSQVFGAGGDFITAPHISPLFSQCIARQFQQILSDLNEADILELGAGSGLFAKDVLLELEKRNHLPRNYFIYEFSAELRKKQQELLQASCPHLMSRIKWVDLFSKEGNDTFHQKFEGIIFSNEVLDAMPFHCFSIENNSFFERSVAWKENQFYWSLTKPSAEFSEKLDELQQEVGFSSPYESEVNLGLSSWIAYLSELLKKGIILFFDYGYGRREYYHPDRSHGTMMCFYKHHQLENPFVYPGLQDITAHVDFTTVVESAVNADLSLAGYTTQASFLLACGLQEIAENQAFSAIDQYQQGQAIKKLILPSQMGELVKVMALQKNFDLPLMGFAFHDRRRDL